ncbi:MAG: hypothetical protein ACOY45_02850 [Pseudomonadota bacterium]
MTRHPVMIGAGAGLLLALAVAPMVGTALGMLARARAAHAALAAAHAALARPPVPLVAADAAIPATDDRAAREWAAARIREQARAGGVLAEEVAPLRAPDGLVAVRLRLSGPEKAVVAMADALERGAPLMRLREWRIEPAGGGAVRLTGVVLGARR